LIPNEVHETSGKFQMHRLLDAHRHVLWLQQLTCKSWGGSDNWLPNRNTTNIALQFMTSPIWKQ